MCDKYLFLFFQFLTLHSKFGFIYTKTLIGHNVRPVNENEFPSVVCIALYNPLNPIMNNVICSGTLVSSTHILTAEHCLCNLEDDAIEILFHYGESRNSLTVYPIWWISYDQWATAYDLHIETTNNDVALLKIIGLTPRVIPTRFANISPNNLLVGNSVQVVGCGRISNDLCPTTMQTVNVRIINLEKCKTHISQLEREHLYLPANYMCTADEPYKLLCHGDSGGPVIYNGNIIGINAGISPPMAGQFHPERVNLHVLIEFYRHFFNYYFNYSR